MFSLMKQVFIVLLSFNVSVNQWNKRANKMSLIDETCMIWPKYIDVNPVELKNYLFMISLDKLVETVMSYQQKCVFEKKQKT